MKRDDFLPPKELFDLTTSAGKLAERITREQLIQGEKFRHLAENLAGIQSGAVLSLAAEVAKRRATWDQQLMEKLFLPKANERLLATLTQVAKSQLFDPELFTAKAATLQVVKDIM